MIAISTLVPVDPFKKALQIAERTGLPQRESFFKVCSFIEANKKEWIKKIGEIKTSNPCLHFSKKATHLPYTIQFHDNGKTYILLGKKTLVGFGTFKKVARAIEFESLKVVAYAVMKLDPNNFKLAMNELKQLEVFKEETELKRIYISQMYAGGLYKGFEGSPKLSLIMKHYNKGDLLTLMQERPLKGCEVRKIAGDIIKGLAFMHSKGMVHQDLKPENVFINQEGSDIRASLGDLAFSVSAFIVEKLGFVGTSTHTSPEKMRASIITDRVAITNDIWSLGTTLFELYFRRAPDWVEFIEKDYNSPLKDLAPSIEQLVLESFPEPEEKRSFEHLIWRMVRPNPDDRPDMEAIEKFYDETYPYWC